MCVKYENSKLDMLTSHHDLSMYVSSCTCLRKVSVFTLESSQGLFHISAYMVSVVLHIIIRLILVKHIICLSVIIKLTCLYSVVTFDLCHIKVCSL